MYLTNRLVHPEGSLPDITMMNLNAESEMLDKEEKQVDIYAQQKSHDQDSGDEWEKEDNKGGGEGGGDTEEEEPETEESEEEEETTTGIHHILCFCQSTMDLTLDFFI